MAEKPTPKSFKGVVVWPVTIPKPVLRCHFLFSQLKDQLLPSIKGGLLPQLTPNFRLSE